MELTVKEKDKILNLCLYHPEKSCAIVQEFIDNLQLVECSVYGKAKGKSKRTILYKRNKLPGINIIGRRILTLNC